MALSKDEILDAIAEMSVMDIVELVEAMEEKFGVSAAAWITHVFTCLSDDRWGFLIAGAIMFPIAIVHGVGIWFGAW